MSADVAYADIQAQAESSDIQVIKVFVTNG